MTKHPFNGQTGAATVVVVAGMFGLMAICAASLSSALTEHTAEAVATEAEHAVRFAEAGTAFALHELDLNHDFGADGIGRCSFSLEGGSSTVTISPAFNGANNYTLHAIGTHNRVQRAIDTIARVRGTRFSQGLFGTDSLTFTGVYSTDSYDSQLGPYLTQVGPRGVAGSDGDVGTNGNISMVGASTVHGDARPGPTGTFSGNPTAVSGTTAPSPEPRVLDPYAYSPTISTGGNLTGTAILTSGNYRYGQVDLGALSVVTIAGNVTLYCDGNFSMTGQSRILVSPGASLTIHHGSGDFKIAGGGIVNTNQLPPNLQLYSATSGNFKITGGSNFYGAVYAPTSTFTSSGGANLYGAVVARALTLVGTAAFHYDAALTSVGGATVTILMQRSAKP